MAPGNMRLFVPVLLATALLAACASEPPPEQFPELSWTHYPEINLKVAKIEVVREYQSSGVSPHLDTVTPRTLIDSADRWALERLHAVGDAGFARFVITDASVLETRLPVQTGTSYSFTRQQNRRFDAAVAVRLEIHNARGFIDAQVNAEAANAHTVAQDATRRAIEEAQYLVVQGAMLDLNAQLDRNIPQFLARFLQP